MRIIALVALAGVLGAPLTARAEVRAGKFVGVYKLGTESACAVAVEIGEAVGGLFNGDETLAFGSTAVGTFKSMLSSSLSLKAGDVVLFGSPAFDAAAGFKSDVEIGDSDCATLNAGVDLEFSGSFGGSLDKWQLPTGFGLNKAYTGNPPDLVDLLVTALQVRALLGAGGSVGTAGGGPGPDPGPGGGAEEDTGGCNVGGSAGSSSTALVIVGLGLALALRRRRRRRD